MSFFALCAIHMHICAHFQDDNRMHEHCCSSAKGSHIIGLASLRRVLHHNPLAAANDHIAEEITRLHTHRDTRIWVHV